MEKAMNAYYRVKLASTNRSICALSGDRRFLFSVTMRLSALNKRSESALDGGTARYLRAVVASSGKRLLFSFHQRSVFAVWAFTSQDRESKFSRLKSCSSSQAEGESLVDRKWPSEVQPEDDLFLPEQPALQSVIGKYQHHQISGPYLCNDIQDDDSLLIVASRAGSRVPPMLGWIQLFIALVCGSAWLAAASVRAAIRSNSPILGNDKSNSSATLPHSVMTSSSVLFDSRAAYGFPLFCALSMLLSSILALYYSRTAYTTVLRVYRAHSLINLTLHFIAIVPLALAWTQQQSLVSVAALQSVSGAAVLLGWFLVLASVLCDHCVGGRNVFQVAGLFLRAVQGGSRSGSISELGRSCNALTPANVIQLNPSNCGLNDRLQTADRQQQQDDNATRDLDFRDHYYEQRQSLLTRQLLV